MLCWCRLPIREPQAAGSAGGSNAGKTGGLYKTPVDVRQPQQQDLNKMDPVFPGGLATQISRQYFGVTRNPIQSPIQIPLVKQHPQLMAPEEERKQFMPHEEDMNLQINKLRQEKEKLLDQILFLERQLASKNLQGQSYLDDSKTATPALLATAIDTVRDIGKKFTKELMDQLNKCPENIRLAVEDHILKQVAVVIPVLTHKKFQYRAYMNHKLFIGFDHPTFFMSIDDVDEPPLEFSEMQKSEWYRKDNFQKFQKYDLRKFSVKTLVETAEHDLFLREFCFMKFQATFDELTESQLFGHLQHRDCILREKKHPNTPFYESFCKLAVSVWLVHRLAFAFKTPATTFVVAKGLPFDHQKMQSAGPRDDITPNSRVGLVVLPGFQANESIIPCEVYLVGQSLQAHYTMSFGDITHL